MFRFEWEDNFSVGDDTIDSQHKELLVVMNDLHLAMVQGKGKDKVQKLLKTLLDQANRHFLYEEDYLVKIGYSNSPEHKQMHDEFVRNIDQYLIGCEHPKFGLAIDVMKYLKSWFEEHVLTEDKKYAK